jgi:predicted dehydrogenase
MADFDLVKDARLAAVYSRTRANAELFASEYGSPQVFDSIEDMIKNGGVEIMYIGISHPWHFEAVLKCIEGGVPVLCEKPLTTNLDLARKMVSAARERNVFLMEAFWTRFFPASQAIVKWINEGRIGRIVNVNATIGYIASTDPSNSRVNPNNAGGALLDIGSYAVNFANFVTGEAPIDSAITSVRHYLTGVDANDAFVLAYPSGALASLSCTLYSETGDAAVIAGSKGRIVVPGQFHHPLSAILYENERETERVEISPDHGEGFSHEFNHVQECVAKGLTESPVMPLGDTLANMATLTELRGKIGLVYPFETKHI